MDTNFQRGNHLLKPLKWYRSLHDHRFRSSENAFLVEGPRHLSQIIKTNPESIIEILLVEDAPYLGQFQNFPIRTLTKFQFNAIATTKTPQPVMAVVRLPLDCYTENLPNECGALILLLEDVQDPGNVGTLLRSAAAFNFTGAILSDSCADPFGPKSVQASAGAILSLWIRRSSGYRMLLDKLHKNGYLLVATTLDGSLSPSYGNTDKRILLLGNEGNGLSSGLLDISDYRMTIPYNSKAVESMNVAAAGAICMFLMSKRGDL